MKEQGQILGVLKSHQVAAHAWQGPERGTPAWSKLETGWISAARLMEILLQPAVMLVVLKKLQIERDD